MRNWRKKQMLTFALAINRHGDLMNYGTGEIFWDAEQGFGFASPEALNDSRPEFFHAHTFAEAMGQTLSISEVSGGRWRERRIFVLGRRDMGRRKSGIGETHARYTLFRRWFCRCRRRSLVGA